MIELVLKSFGRMLWRDNTRVYCGLTPPGVVLIDEYCPHLKVSSLLDIRSIGDSISHAYWMHY